MVWIDYAIMAVLGLSCLVSLIRGFVREALSLVTWGCAFYVASHYYADLSVWFTGFEDERLNHQQIKLLMLKSGSDRLLEVINAINNH